MPTFKACSGDKPARFKKSFLEYPKAINANRQNFKHVISQALQGPALEWWEHIEPIIYTMEQFRTRFLGRYWNSALQSRVRRELEFGYYRGDMGVNRSEYVLSLYNDVRMLDDMPNIGSIIDKFSRHFDEHVQAAVLSRGIPTMGGLIELLDTSDLIGDLNSYRAAQTMPITSQPPPRYPLQKNLSFEKPSQPYRQNDTRSTQ